MIRIAFAVAALAASVAHTFAAVPVITSAITATGAVGASFNYQIVSTESPTLFGAAPLPPGLVFNSGSGTISGTPTTAGVFFVGISATNASGVATSSLTVKVTGIPVTTAESSPTNGILLPSNADIANSDRSSFGSIEITSGGPQFGSTVSSLVEGSMYGSAAPTNTVSSLTPADGTIAVLKFNTAVEPAGYDIARIDVYTGTGQNRGMQSYSVAWAPPNSSTYLPLFTVTNAGDPTIAELRTRTIDQPSNGAAPIATGVGSLRFTFLNTSAANPQSMYREIDVFGPSFAPVITSPTVASTTFNAAFNYQITAAYSPFSFGATPLPAGLSINSSGLISGSPASTVGSPFTITLSATNAVGVGSAPLLLTVSKANATVTLSDLDPTYDGTAKSPIVTTSPAGEPVNLSYVGPNLPATNAGSYSVLATIAPSSNYTGSGSGTLVIKPAAAQISLSNLAQSFNGTPRIVTPTVTPAAAGVALTYNGSATPPTNVGQYAVVASTTNPNYTGTKSGTLIITDTTPPVLSLPANIVVEATGPAGAPVTFAATASDDVDGAVAVNLSAASGTAFPLGTTTVKVSATNAAGLTANSSFTVTVRDTTAPVFSALTASSVTLWPADHKMVAITLTATTSDLVSAVSTRIIDVINSEVPKSSGKGPTPIDAEITGAMTLNLRAERTGNDRMYTVNVKATDAAGNSTMRSVPITVGKAGKEK